MSSIVDNIASYLTKVLGMSNPDVTPPTFYSKDTLTELTTRGIYSGLVFGIAIALAGPEYAHALILEDSIKYNDPKWVRWTTSNKAYAIIELFPIELTDSKESDEQ
jgi:hypothetical protein